MARIDIDSTVSWSKDVVFQELESEAILLNLESGVYFGLDPVGTRMWQLIGEHGNLSSVVASLADEYAAEEPKLREDLLRLVEDLAKSGLVDVRA